MRFSANQFVRLSDPLTNWFAEKRIIGRTDDAFFREPVCEGIGEPLQECGVLHAVLVHVPSLLLEFGFLFVRGSDVDHVRALGVLIVLESLFDEVWSGGGRQWVAQRDRFPRSVDTGGGSDGPGAGFDGDGLILRKA